MHASEDHHIKVGRFKLMYKREMITCSKHSILTFSNATAKLIVRDVNDQLFCSVWWHPGSSFIISVHALKINFVAWCSFTVLWNCTSRILICLFWCHRLSKGISVADVLVECQELEKFCVTNHFARYHSRVPDPGASDSASSLTGVASVRPFLQRYVSAVPLPPKLPEGVQCLSLWSKF